jgi:hypothetical protein
MGLIGNSQYLTIGETANKMLFDQLTESQLIDNLLGFLDMTPHLAWVEGFLLWT